MLTDNVQYEHDYPSVGTPRVASLERTCRYDFLGGCGSALFLSVGSLFRVLWCPFFHTRLYRARRASFC